MYTEITKEIYNIGYSDSSLRVFENQYPVPDGITYNSYIIQSEGVTAVVDAVDKRGIDEWLTTVESVAAEGVDRLIIQHMEPDHSAGVVKLCDRYPRMQLVCTAAAARILRQFFPDYDFKDRITEVKDGDTLAVGRHTLVFATAPMVHWPEVMVTFDSTEGVLFSADAFGTFGTRGNINELWPDEARRYYTNIVGKYGPQVRKALEKVCGIKGVEKIAPLHGPVLEGDMIDEGLRLYSLWSGYIPELPDGVLVAYASIYGNTAEAARMVAGILERENRTVTTCDLCVTDVSEAVSQAFRMGTMVVASPTYDAGLYPAMHDFLWHLQIKGLCNRRFGVIENGSWAPVAAKAMIAMIDSLRGCEIVGTPVTVRSAINTDSATALENLAKEL